MEDRRGQAEEFAQEWTAAEQRGDAAHAVGLQQGSVPGAHDALVVHEPEMVVVERVFRMAAEGFGVGKIQSRLYAEGLPSPRGRDVWDRRVIRKIIKSDEYRPLTHEEISELVSPEVLARLEADREYSVQWYNRDQVTVRTISESDGNGGRTYKKRKTQRRRPKEEWLAIPVPAYLPRDLVDRARAAMDASKGAERKHLARECEQHRGMHLFEDLVITEVVDKDNRPVPPGVYGHKVLVTVLFSRTMPLIRYGMSDSVKLATSPHCPCGRTFALIDGIQGRVEDVLRFPATSGEQVSVEPIVFHRVMDSVPAGGWQVAEGPEGLTVLLSGVREGFADVTLVDTLRRELKAQGAIVPQVEVRRVPNIPRTTVGKAPLIRARVPGPWRKP